MSKTTKNTCQEMVSPPGSFRTYPCGKAAKGQLKNGIPACGIHLNAEKRRDASREKFDMEWDERARFNKEVDSFCSDHEIDGVRSSGRDDVIVKWDTFKAIVIQGREK